MRNARDAAPMSPWTYAAHSSSTTPMNALHHAGSADFFGASCNYVLEPSEVSGFLSHFVAGHELKGKAVLDVGCRMGEFAAEVAKLGARVSGIDISRKCIEQARALHPELASQLSIADVRDLSGFKAESFDLVLCLGVMPYLHPREWMPALAQMARLCKDDGKLLVLFQKPRSGVFKAVVGMANSIPPWLYVNVVCPVGAAVLAPVSPWLLGSRISTEAFKYRVLLSLRGLHFGYPPAISHLSVPVPTSNFASATTTVAFVLDRAAVLEASAATI